MWFREYMVESSEDNISSASLPYGLLISRIIVNSLVDLSQFMPALIDATYDTRTFSSMGYVLINDKWYKKESVQQRADAPYPRPLASQLTQLLCFSKSRTLSSTDVGKLRLEVEGLKKEVIRSVNTILKEVNSIKSGVDSAYNKLAVTVHTSYSNFSKNVERTYNTFCRNVFNTLKYFLGDR
ncbi:hypothetical protein KY290_026127 [Solanum tuberosum]|uniref:Uncharacterized protein n=2 Tax=Solanum tuberosum TaxID=4113 RepID=A0ABQ7UXM7_SOLTU|nr:hypothetical protein KY289_025222 [Solanum tuberosum]KAH0673893.1 hypothetical protein KY284_024980 [Solanum tuberosum]KAH0755857.1 hypothetical protein KY290_026127 [Solanum tuberosum]